MVGEIKSMDKGVLLIETDYSDSDFKIEWSGISEIYANSFFLISLTNGARYNGSFKTIDPPNILIESIEGIAKATMDEIVYLKSVDRDFWSRLHASIDFGLSLTRANNLQQFNTRANLGYLADRWSSDFTFSTLFSKQDEVEATKRADASGSFNWFLPKDWFIPATISTLSNTEQKLDLRLNGKLGIGRYLIHTNQTYWGFSLGASYNNERYANEAENRSNLEGFLGTELNLYDTGDLSLLTQVVIYPGITDTERFRSDMKLDAKYDLPMDLYIKFGITVNYDNKPAAGTSETDYIIQTGFGWEL